MKDYYDFTAKPSTVWMTVNRACNFRCKWCYAKDTQYDNKDNMSLDLAKKLLLLVKELGIYHVTLIGGEPTLWPHLLQFNVFAKNNGISTSIITNAYMFSDDEYWTSYVESSCDGVGISIKGVTTEQMETITGNSSTLPDTLLGISRAIKFHKNVSIGTVYSSLTSKNDILEIALKAKELGAESFTLSPCGITMQDDLPSTEYVKKPSDLIDDIVDIYPKLNEQFGSKLSIEMSLPYCFWPTDFIETLFHKEQLTSECHVHDRSGLVFDHNGNILFCNNMINVCVAKYGSDFTNSKELIEHLNKKEMCNEYAEILRYPSIVCSDCQKKDICRGGCNINWTVLDPEICKAM